MTETFPDAFIVLTGGRGRRLGDVDKAMVRLGGVTLLDRALATTAGRPVVLVGPHVVDRSGVRTVSEDPPGGGPAAGIAAGLADLAGGGPTAVLVGVLAIDQPGVTEKTWQRLARAVGPDVPGAILVAQDRRQYGVGVYRAGALLRAVAARDSWHGMPLRTLLDPLAGAELPAGPDEAHDIDTPDDLAWWQHRVGGAD